MMNSNVQTKKENINVKRGEIWMVAIPKLKDEDTVSRRLQKGERPFLITSNWRNNGHSDVINGVYLTSKMSKAKLPTHVEAGKESGLIMDSIILCEAPDSVDKVDLRRLVGFCQEYKMKQVEYAMKVQSELIEPFSIKLVNEKVFLVTKLNELFKATLSTDMKRMYISALNDLRRYVGDYPDKDIRNFYNDTTENNTNTNVRNLRVV